MQIQTLWISIPFKNWYQQTQHLYLWRLTVKQNIKYDGQRLQTGFPTDLQYFQGNPRWFTCFPIFHIIYSTLYFVNINSLHCIYHLTTSNFVCSLIFIIHQFFFIYYFQICLQSFTSTFTHHFHF